MIWYSDRVQSTYWPWSEASVSVITGITLSLARPLGPNQTTPVAFQTRTTLSHSCLRHITKEHRQKHQISSAQWGSCTRLETSIKIPQTASESFQRQRWGNFWEMGWSAYNLFLTFSSQGIRTKKTFYLFCHFTVIWLVSISTLQFTWL